jgi:cell division protein FtsZ
MSGSDDIDMDEFGDITDYIQEAAGGSAELITGYGTDSTLGDHVSVTIIATGFKTNQNAGQENPFVRDRKVVNLDETPVEVVNEPVQTNIIDAIQNTEPFVYIRNEVEEELLSETNLPEFDLNEELQMSSIEEYSSENSEEAVTETKNEEFTFNVIVDETPSVQSNSNVEIRSSNEQDTIEREEQIRLAQERIRKLKEITLKMRSPEGLAALEKQTAFERKNIVLENKMPSQESHVSRYTLSEGSDKKLEIRQNNSFLHDRPD